MPTLGLRPSSGSTDAMAAAAAAAAASASAPIAATSALRAPADAALGAAVGSGAGTAVRACSASSAFLATSDSALRAGSRLRSGERVRTLWHSLMGACAAAANAEAAAALATAVVSGEVGTASSGLRLGDAGAVLLGGVVASGWGLGAAARAMAATEAAAAVTALTSCPRDQLTALLSVGAASKLGDVSGETRLVPACSTLEGLRLRVGRSRPPPLPATPPGLGGSSTSVVGSWGALLRPVPCPSPAACSSM
mmetsp:Transcript_36669/g.92635  ORF Transcript_36669/g.92635 Transcript_36669/m.92635 type:complete len:252 (+) Transcript_36669:542-1297(+)